MAGYRPWHLRLCAARLVAAVADEDVDGSCTCPAERFLSRRVRPVWEAGDRHWWQRAGRRLRARVLFFR